MERRRFVKALMGASVIASRVKAQSAPDWGGPVLDTHLHLTKGFWCKFRIRPKSDGFVLLK